MTTTVPSWHDGAATRLKRPDDALGELRRAAELEPDRARYAYVYAIGLHSAGRIADATAALKESLARHPADRDTLMALVTFNRDAGDVGSALDYAEQLARIEPANRDLADLIRELRRQVSKPDALQSSSDPIAASIRTNLRLQFNRDYLKFSMF
jgi:cytochrome c-type biogenesis protein CcmH/NrfG